MNLHSIPVEITRTSHSPWITIPEDDEGSAERGNRSVSYLISSYNDNRDILIFVTTPDNMEK